MDKANQDAAKRAAENAAKLALLRMLVRLVEGIRAGRVLPDEPRRKA